MKIKYEFATETVEIEVTEEWAKVIKELDRQEYNSNHRESRRHTSLSNGVDDYEWLSCDRYEPFEVLTAAEKSEKITNAVSSLCETQQELIEKLFDENMSINVYASLNNIDHSAVSHRIRRIRKKLDELL